MYYIEKCIQTLKEVQPDTLSSYVHWGLLKLPSTTCTYIPTKPEWCRHPSEPPKGRPPRSTYFITFKKSRVLKTSTKTVLTNTFCIKIIKVYASNANNYAQYVSLI